MNPPKHQVADNPPDPRALFGQRLRELRLSRGFSQEELADLAGLDRTYISSCERGRRNISLQNIYRLAEALGVEPWQLLLSGNTKPCQTR